MSAKLAYSVVLPLGSPSSAYAGSCKPSLPETCPIPEMKIPFLKPEMNTSPTPAAADIPVTDNLEDLLREVQRRYTRNDDLPDNLLLRIEQLLCALQASDSAATPQPVMEITIRQALELVGFYGGHLPLQKHSTVQGWIDGAVRGMTPVITAPPDGQGKPE